MNVVDKRLILLTRETRSFGNKFTEIFQKDYTLKTIRIFTKGKK
jgi:hypothetical protein